MRDLLIYERGRKLTNSYYLIYRIAQKYPKDELFGLTSQTRRAAVSVSSNIAEGFGRGTRKDKLQFYSIARTSIAEVEDQLIVARDLAYITDGVFNEAFALAEEVVGLVVGLERSAADKHTQR